MPDVGYSLYSNVLAPRLFWCLMKELTCIFALARVSSLPNDCLTNGYSCILCRLSAGVLAECGAAASAASPLRPLRGGPLLVRRGAGVQPRAAEQTVGPAVYFNHRAASSSCIRQRKFSMFTLKSDWRKRPLGNMVAGMAASASCRRRHGVRCWGSSKERCVGFLRAIWVMLF